MAKDPRTLPPASERAVVIGVPDIYMARALAALEDNGIPVVGAWLSRTAVEPVDRYLRRRNPAFCAWTFLERAQVKPEPLWSRRHLPQLKEGLQRTGATFLLNVNSWLRITGDILALLPARCMNLHPALLPAQRGPHPLDFLLAKGLAATEGGATLHAMSEGIDEGPIVAVERVPLFADLDVVAWELALARAYGTLCREPLRDYLSGKRAAVPQDKSKAGLAKLYDLAKEMHLHEGLRAEEALYRAKVFGQPQVFGEPRDRLQISAGGRRWHAVLPARVIGPASGQPPQRSLWPWRYTFDVADARLSLRRRWPGWKRLQQLQSWRRWAKAKP